MDIPGTELHGGLVESLREFLNAESAAPPAILYHVRLNSPLFTCAVLAGGRRDGLEYSLAVLPRLSPTAGDERNFSVLAGFAGSASKSVGVTASVMNLDYEWQRPYFAAVLETDRTKLPQLIEEARTAISARACELNQDLQGPPAEGMALEFALDRLKLLSREVAQPRPHSAKPHF